MQHYSSAWLSLQVKKELAASTRNFKEAGTLSQQLKQAQANQELIREQLVQMEVLTRATRRDMLQHSATCCSTAQRVATRRCCNTAQHVATCYKHGNPVHQQQGLPIARPAPPRR